MFYIISAALLILCLIVGTQPRRGKKRFFYPWWLILLRAPGALLILPFSFLWHFSLGWAGRPATSCPTH